MPERRGYIRWVCPNQLRLFPVLGKPFLESIILHDLPRAYSRLPWACSRSVYHSSWFAASISSTSALQLFSVRLSFFMICREHIIDISLELALGPSTMLHVTRTIYKITVKFRFRYRWLYFRNVSWFVRPRQQQPRRMSEIESGMSDLPRITARILAHFLCYRAFLSKIILPFLYG